MDTTIICLWVGVVILLIRSIGQQRLFGKLQKRQENFENFVLKSKILDLELLKGIQENQLIILRKVKILEMESYSTTKVVDHFMNKAKGKKK